MIFISNIIITNKKRTATAPIYTISSIIAKNSALENKKRIEVLKKTSIKNKTEWIGFFDVITNSDEVIINIDTIKNKKIVKISL